MKIALLIVSAALLTGCTYTGYKTPLQPGEKVVFHTQERANQFREVSGNDASNGGRFVEITKPTTLVTE
jgi:outer membrane biogenesis lipoprotein LolB